MLTLPLRTLCGLPGAVIGPYSRAVGRTKLWLIALLIALQLADVVTTNRGLEHSGIWEANPLVALSMTSLGAFWWAPLKISFVCYVLLAAPRIRWTWPLGLVSGIFLVIVGNNLAYW